MRKFLLTPIVVLAIMLIALAAMTVATHYELDVGPGRLSMQPGE